jgi:uncharacterized membrane-anchored protein
MTVQFNVEDIQKAKEFLAHVNSFNLEDIEFIQNGEPIILDEDTIEDWKFIGLNNSDLVMMEIFKDHS